MRDWLKEIINTHRHQKPTDENILRLLLPSIIGIILCLICLVDSTWAWFTAAIQTKPQTIEAANFDVSVTITDENGTSVGFSEQLLAGKAYKVTLTATGNAPSGGYCKVVYGSVSLYTIPLRHGNSISFTLIPETDAVYTFVGVWGSYSGEADITDGCTVGQKSADPIAENADTSSEPANQPIPSDSANSLPESTEPESAPTESEEAVPEKTGESSEIIESTGDETAENDI